MKWQEKREQGPQRRHGGDKERPAEATGLGQRELKAPVAVTVGKGIQTTKD